MRSLLFFSRRYKNLLCFLMLGASALNHHVAAEELSLLGYQTKDGAITAKFNGDVVDPYFANRALLTALDDGLDIRQSGAAWIGWALQQQNPDGSFDRFCLREGIFVSCAKADADDAGLAVWMDLLAKMAPAGNMPAAWERSLQKAENHLMSLYDEGSGVYLISNTQPVGLLMDNIEIYGAFNALAGWYLASKNLERWRTLKDQADQLAGNIIRTFWQPCLRRFRVSTQIISNNRFYPDEIAQVFPMFLGLSSPLADDKKMLREWMARNQTLWLHRASIDYPWGVIAEIAAKKGGDQAVKCWLSHVQSLRHGAHWNVLEEAIYQALQKRGLAKLDNPGACLGGGAGSIQTADNQPLDKKSPSVPTGLAIVDKTETSVALTWNKSTDDTGVIGYDIYRDGDRIDTSMEPNYTDAGLVLGKTYSYMVKALDNAENYSGESNVVTAKMEPSNIVRIYYATGKSHAIVRYRLKGDNDTALLEASMENACAGYKVKVVELKGADSLTAAFADDENKSDDNTGKFYTLMRGTWLIKNQVLTAEFPCIDVTPPSSPSQLNVTLVGRGQVSIAWLPARDDQAVGGYRIVRNGAEIAETTGLSYLDSSCLEPSTSYTYTVKAFDSSGNVSVNNHRITITIPGGSESTKTVGTVSIGHGVSDLCSTMRLGSLHL